MVRVYYNALAQYMYCYMTRKLMVAGNWKLHGSLAITRNLISEIITGLPVNKKFDVAVFPPFTYISEAVAVAGNDVICGGQTLSEHEVGAYTGEVSGAMLQELGCQMVLVGHSERRSYYHENNQTVANKFCSSTKEWFKANFMLW